MPPSNTNTPQKESDPNRALRFIVVSMGLVLVGGLVLLFVLLALGAHKKDRAPYVKADCLKTETSIPKGERIRSVTSDEDTVRVLSETPDGHTVLRHIALCSGEVTHRLLLTRE